ncbi:MAG: amidase family protein, partial [Caulobacteraceae bacterium]
MIIPEYETYDAVGLADLIAKRALTPGELLDAALERVDAVNPKINAVIRTLEPHARRAIDEGLPDGPLHGVPFLLKDISARMRGAPTSAGSRLFVDTIADEDSAVVA